MQKELEDEDETTLPPPPVFSNQDDNNEQKLTYDADGFLRCGGDGACPNQGCGEQSLLRSGYSIYYAPRHPCNRRAKVRGVSQGAQRAEVAACRNWICWA